ncbi:UDP-glucosyltransferase [Pseudonocardiaceae bacterium YIM PH 21723]|nr:UDP-glucosyltransferase [Pseudonocardiaceae bacterium YIM PH 21723]
MTKHIAIICMPAHGHLTPVLAVTRELVNQGYRVTIPTLEEHRAQVEASGAAAPLYHSPLVEQFAAKKDEMRDAPPAEFKVEEILPMFFGEAGATAPQFVELFENDRPDLLVYDQITWAGALVADRWQVPHVILYPSTVPTQGSNAFRDMVEQIADPGTAAAVQGALDTARAGSGLEPLPVLDFLGTQPELGIAFMTRSFQPEGETLDDRYQFVGPCLGDRISNTGWQPKDAERPLLYVSLGSGFNNQPAFYRTVIEAFRDEPWQVVLVTGQSVQLSELGDDLPDNFEFHAFAPQLEILPHATVFLTHNGMGGTQEGLSFGVPMLGLPQMSEQETNADRVVELGLGRRLPAKPTAAELRAAVAEILEDPDIHKRLEAMKWDIEAAGGTKRAADLLADAVRRFQA